MKTSIEKSEGLLRKLAIEVPEDKVNQAFDRFYRGIQKNATIKGFRKGKAPLDTVRKLYTDQVKQDVLQQLVGEGYEAALSEHALSPIGQPHLHFDELEEKKDFKFTAEFEVRPEVKVSKVEGLKVEKEKIEVDDEQITTMLENLRSSRMEHIPLIEIRPLQEGDVAVIDFEGTIEGEPLQGGSAQDHKLEIGSNSFIPGFEEGLMGMNVNDQRDVNLNFPEDYHAAEIAGKPVLFKVTLKAIEKKVLPELDDKFAESIGSYKTVDELKTAIREDLENRETQRIQEDLKSRVLKALVSENPVDVPKSLHESQKHALMQDVQGRMAQQGMGPNDFEEYKEKWSEDFEETASFLVQSHFLVDQLAKDLNLNASQEDVDARLKEHAEGTGIELSKLKEYYADADRRSHLRFKITEDKVVEHLLEKASVTEVPKDKLSDKPTN